MDHPGAAARADAGPAVRPRYLAMLGAAALVGLGVLPVLFDLARPMLPIDMAVYRDAALSVVHGQPLYRADLGADTLGLVFTYPPFAVLVMLPFALAPLTVDWVLVGAVSVLCLAGVVRLSYQPLLRRVEARRRPVAVAGLVAAGMLTSPVTYQLSLGQIGTVVTLLCLADVAVEHPRWPRGVLVGLATAVKLTPALFVVYFLVTRQWRAAVVSTVTVAAAWGATALVLPTDSRTFFLGGVLGDQDRVGDVANPTNQSLHGLLLRATGSPTTAVWLFLSGAVVVVALLRARRAEQLGAPVAAATLVGLASLLVSPISWIHHGSWIVPAAGVILGDGRQVRRVAGSVLVLLAGVVTPIRFSWAGHGLPAMPAPLHWWGHEWLVVLYLALLVTLPLSSGRPDPSGEREHDAGDAEPHRRHGGGRHQRP